MQQFFAYIKGKVKQDTMNPHNWFVSVLVIAIILIPLVKSKADMDLKITLAVIYILLYPLVYVFINWIRYRKYQKKSERGS